jgi:FkbM family methyltransferase
VDPRVLTLNVRGGARICVPRSLEHITTYVLLEQEDWFEDEIRFLRRWLRPGMRALDVGASYGVFAASIAKGVTPSGRVWAFEPTPQTARLLKRTLELNRFTQVHLVKQAVADRTGKVAFSLNPSSEMNAIDAGGAQAEVPCTTLDRAAQAYAWNDLDFVKLDVEGAELAAIAGGEELFSRLSPLVMLEIKAGSYADTRALQPLAAAGYETYRLLPAALVLVPFDPQGQVDSFQLNAFACKPDRAEQLAAQGLLSRDAAPRLQAELERAAGDPDSLERTLTRARIAHELGARTLAVQCLEEALGRMQRGGAEERLRCTVVEQYERLRAYSSLFSGTSSLEVLAPVLGSPFCSPEMERRRQLVRLRAGLQREPEAVPLLSAASEENLNPAFWRGEI